MGVGRPYEIALLARPPDYQGIKWRLLCDPGKRKDSRLFRSRLAESGKPRTPDCLPKTLILRYDSEEPPRLGLCLTQMRVTPRYSIVINASFRSAARVDSFRRR